MLNQLVWSTIVVCVAAALIAYATTRDVFHPAILLAALCTFTYGYMPLSLLKEQTLYLYVTEPQAEFLQWVALLGITALLAGCFVGAVNKPAPATAQPEYSWQVLQRGAYILGAIGTLCWLYTIHVAGGFTSAFGDAGGSGWSQIGYIRDAVYLLVVAIILLITPQVYPHRDKVWYVAVILFTIPWLVQGLLGARRGPTFIIACTIGMSWYLAHKRRPPLVVMVAAATALGMLMLFLVTNRGQIYIGSDFSGVKTDVTDVVSEANESNEYIFGIGCIETAKRTNHYFWGKRYLAQFIVRPIPHQLWPNKYQDFGVPELLQNAGVAGAGLNQIMSWTETPGAAAAMIADFWVEFQWFLVPVLFIVGRTYGVVWRRAVRDGSLWNSQYTIFAILAVYLVTQSGEAVIFRFFLLTLPTRYVWRKAQLPVTAEEFAPEELALS